jgi:2-polyprenyl-3-methyl-5-hydroxy-6-metoxy-1,4-benzoquinol methylase
MPTSASEAIPYIVEFLREEVPHPKRILDVGVGFGKLGFLIRDYFEAKDHLRLTKDEWRIKIVGIEIYRKYISELQKYIYDQILIGDVFDKLPTLGKFDVALLGDILEHFEKEDGHRLLAELFKHTKNIVVSTPSGYKAQSRIGGNSNEAHKSGWTMKDFKRYSIVKEKSIPRIRRKENVLVVFLRQS